MAGIDAAVKHKRSTGMASRQTKLAPRPVAAVIRAEAVVRLGMAEESVEAGGGDQQVIAARPVECRALIAYDAAAAAQARSGGASSAGGTETSGVGSSNTNDSSGSTSGSAAWEDGTRKANHGFVGLSNQGATCYMNSLLQTLYMTPEFRAALYRWKCEKEEDDDCIPLQLQRLFGLLQLSSRGAVETNALTRSFGWTSSDGFQQHDVQELCKVLFDAFEREVKDTPQSTLVNDLYQGTMTNYVRCKECGKESQSPDTFLELSLVMRPFGSKEVMSSVLESLDYCLKPETLEGDNQYFCDNCQKKVDAVKGCKFSKLPYLLCLQLKRFDYDFTTFTRIKLNDEMRFPLTIDMNPYMRQAEANDDEEAKDHGPSPPSDASPTAGEPEGKSCEEPSSAAAMAQPVPDLVDAEGSKCPEQAKEEELSAMNEEERSFHSEWEGARLVEEKGPYVYELYAVLIHSGSALGGHYYAYIRSLEDGEWYNFNDSTVTRIDVATVKRAWGGPWAAGYGGSAAKRPYYRGLGYSGANAYMLMYRRIEPSRNAGFPVDSEVPAYVREGVAKDEERAERERQEHDERLNALTVRLITSTVPEGVPLTVSKKDTLAVVREKAWRALKLAEGSSAIPLDCLRLREYGDSVYATQVKEEPLKDEEATMEKLGIMQYRRLFVETRRPGEDWPAIKQTDLTLHVRKYDAASDTLLPHQLVFVPRSCTVGELKKQLAETFREEAQGDASRVRVAIDKVGGTRDYWTKRIETLRREEARLADDCGVTQFAKVYVAIGDGQGVVAEEETGQVEEKGGAKEPTAADVLDMEEGAGSMEEEVEVVVVDPMEEALNRENNTWTVKVAAIDQEEEARTVPQDQVVEMKIDRRDKIASLRAMVSERWQLEDSEFKLLVKKHYSLAEVKGVDTLIKECSPSLFNGSHIYVMRGTPLRDGEHVFRLLELKTRFRPGVVRSARVERCSKCAEERKRAAAVVTNEGASDEADQGHTEEKACGDGRTTIPPPPDAQLADEPPPPADEGGDGKADGGEARAPSPAAVEGEGAGQGNEGEEEGASGGASGSSGGSDFGMTPVECVPAGEDYVERLTLVVNDSMSIGDVRAKVAEKLKEMGLLAQDASPDQIRLRDKMQDRPGKIFRDQDSVRQLMASKLEDTKDMAMQILDEPERLHEQPSAETIVVVQWFCRRCWSLGVRYEFALCNADSFVDGMDRLAEQLGVNPSSGLRILTVIYARSLKLSDLGKDMPLAGKPWLDPQRGPAPYIGDGEVIVCTDVSEPLRELTDAELESVKDEAASDMTSSYRNTGATGGASHRPSWTSTTTYSWKRPAERGVKIRTKEERMKEAEKQQQEATAAAAAASSSPRAVAGGSKGFSRPSVPDDSDVVHTGQIITSLFDDIDAEEEERPSPAMAQEQGERGSSSAGEARESAEYMGL